MSGLILLGGWMSLFWLAVIWWLTMDRRANFSTTTYVALASMFAVVLNSPGIWFGLGRGYPGDSFFTLSGFGQAGVLLISAAGLAAIYALSAAKSRRLLRDQPTRAVLVLLDCIVSVVLFGLIYALSPQIFYAFYQQVIPGLPDQTVLRLPLAIDQMRAAFALDPRGSMASHLAGIGWLGIVPFTLWFHARTSAVRGEIFLILALGWFWLQIANFV